MLRSVPLEFGCLTGYHTNDKLSVSLCLFRGPLQVKKKTTGFNVGIVGDLKLKNILVRFEPDCTIQKRFKQS
jgi:hypothetical protein